MNLGLYVPIFFIAISSHRTAVGGFLIFSSKLFQNDKFCILLLTNFTANNLNETFKIT